jgi:hypothetical protein
LPFSDYKVIKTSGIDVITLCNGLSYEISNTEIVKRIDSTIVKPVIKQIEQRVSNKIDHTVCTTMESNRNTDMKISKIDFNLREALQKIEFMKYYVQDLISETKQQHLGLIKEGEIQVIDYTPYREVIASMKTEIELLKLHSEMMNKTEFI